MGVALEDLDASLETATRTLLGDTITYTPSGGSPLTLKALVDYSGSVIQFASSKVMADEGALEVAMSDVPQPTGTDEVQLAKRPGKTYLPKHFEPDETGDAWLIALKKKPGA